MTERSFRRLLLQAQTENGRMCGVVSICGRIDGRGIIFFAVALKQKLYGVGQFPYLAFFFVSPEDIVKK